MRFVCVSLSLFCSPLRFTMHMDENAPKRTPNEINTHIAENYNVLVAFYMPKYSYLDVCSFFFRCLLSTEIHFVYFYCSFFLVASFCAYLCCCFYWLFALTLSQCVHAVRTCVCVCFFFLIVIQLQFEFTISIPLCTFLVFDFQMTVNVRG